MRVHEFLIILFTFGLVALQPGVGALQCYKCDGDSCKVPKLQFCNSSDTTTTEIPTTPTLTTKPGTTTLSTASTKPGTATSSTDSSTASNITSTESGTTTTSTASTKPGTTTSSTASTKPGTATSSTDSSTASNITSTESGTTTTSTASTKPGTTTSSTASTKPGTATSSTDSSTASNITSTESGTTTTSTASTKPGTTTSSTNSSAAAMNIDRKRRSVIDRFSRIQSVNDNVTYHCYSYTVNGTEHKGCTANKNLCTDKDKSSCKVCNTDGCNSATSTVVFTSMIFSLAVIVLFVR